MINPALLKALIPQDVMDNVQNAAQAFIEMKQTIDRIEAKLDTIIEREYGPMQIRKGNILIDGVSTHNGSGKE